VFLIFFLFAFFSPIGKGTIAFSFLPTIPFPFRTFYFLSQAPEPDRSRIQFIWSPFSLVRTSTPSGTCPRPQPPPSQPPTVFCPLVLPSRPWPRTYPLFSLLKGRFSLFWFLIPLFFVCGFHLGFFTAASFLFMCLPVPFSDLSHGLSTTLPPQLLFLASIGPFPPFRFRDPCGWCVPFFLLFLTPILPVCVSCPRSDSLIPVLFSEGVFPQFLPPHLWLVARPLFSPWKRIVLGRVCLSKEFLPRVFFFSPLHVCISRMFCFSGISIVSLLVVHAVLHRALQSKLSRLIFLPPSFFYFPPCCCFLIFVSSNTRLFLSCFQGWCLFFADSLLPFCLKLPTKEFFFLFYPSPRRTFFLRFQTVFAPCALFFFFSSLRNWKLSIGSRFFFRLWPRVSWGPGFSFFSRYSTFSRCGFRCTALFSAPFFARLLRRTSSGF